MKLLNFISLILLIIITSCNNNSDVTNGVKVNAKKIDCDVVFGLPLEIIINNNDSILWISDFYTKHLVYGIHKNTGEIVSQIAEKGNGPSEMLPPVHIFLDDTNLYLHDRSKSNLFCFPINTTLNNRNHLTKLTSLNRDFDLVYKLSDSLYIGTGFFEKRFSIADLSGKELYQTGEYPNYWQGESDFPSNVLSMYHQAIFCINKKNNLFALSTRDVLSIYNFKNNCITKVFQKPLHHYSYKYSKGQILSAYKDMHIPIGSIGITCSNDYIYILYNSNSSNSNNKEINYIKVFDWNGNELTSIIPDVNLSIIAIDIPENTIYGISEDVNPSIYKIQIADI